MNHSLSITNHSASMVADSVAVLEADSVATVN
jgi:hypothetical protein